MIIVAAVRNKIVKAKSTKKAKSHKRRCDESWACWLPRDA